MISRFMNFGMPHDGITVFLPDVKVPAIIGTGLSEFAINRNNDIANTWDIGSFGVPPVRYIRSNLLPTHDAGTVGNAATVLTLVSTNDSTGANVTQLTFSGAGTSDADAIKQGDLLSFKDGVSGKTNVRYMTYIGQAVSASPCQFRATADAASDSSGNVTISIYPAIKWIASNTDAIQVNTPLVAGMQATALPTHQCGLVVGGNALFLAMPKLPKQDPYTTANEYDDDTHVSIRLTYGALIGQNQNLFVHDCVWGSFADPNYCYRLAFPPA